MARSKVLESIRLSTGQLLELTYSHQAACNKLEPYTVLLCGVGISDAPEIDCYKSRPDAEKRFGDIVRNDVLELS